MSAVPHGRRRQTHDGPHRAGLARTAGRLAGCVAPSSTASRFDSEQQAHTCSSDVFPLPAGAETTATFRAADRSRTARRSPRLISPGCDGATSHRPALISMPVTPDAGTAGLARALSLSGQRTYCQRPDPSAAHASGERRMTASEDRPHSTRTQQDPSRVPFADDRHPPLVKYRCIDLRPIHLRSILHS